MSLHELVASFTLGKSPDPISIPMNRV